MEKFYFDSDEQQEHEDYDSLDDEEFMLDDHVECPFGDTDEYSYMEEDDDEDESEESTQTTKLNDDDIKEHKDYEDFEDEITSIVS